MDKLGKQIDTILGLCSDLAAKPTPIWVGRMLALGAIQTCLTEVLLLSF
jgi:hypothetical protein